MRAFEVVTARDPAHALALLADFGPSAQVLAGGTDLLVDLKLAPEVPRVIVDISRVEELKRIALADQGLSIGALATHSQIIRSPLVRDLAPALIAAARTIGAVQTRNLATLGGNLVSAVPSLDSGPVLFALEALVTMIGPGGRRQLPIADFFVAPRKTVLKAGELLAEIVVPRASLRKPTDFQKFGLRKGQALALVSVGASTWIDRGRNAFVAPRIALGAVAPTIVRALDAEAYLEGRAATPEAMAEAGRIAASEARPITDFRASERYRRDLVGVLTRRALTNACAQAHGALREAPR
jgi:carbon-monoxide dehydrogenase medium subunit